MKSNLTFSRHHLSRIIWLRKNFTSSSLGSGISRASKYFDWGCRNCYFVLGYNYLQSFQKVPNSTRFDLQHGHRSPKEDIDNRNMGTSNLYVWSRDSCTSRRSLVRKIWGTHWGSVRSGSIWQPLLLWILRFNYQNVEFGEQKVPANDAPTFELHQCFGYFSRRTILCISRSNHKSLEIWKVANFETYRNIYYKTEQVNKQEFKIWIDSKRWIFCSVYLSFFPSSWSQKCRLREFFFELSIV